MAPAPSATSLGTLSAVTDNGNGTYTATVNTVVGTATITGTLNASALASSASVAFVPGPASHFVVADPGLRGRPVPPSR